MEVQTQNLAGQLADNCICYSATIQIKGTTHLHYLQIAETDCKPTSYYVKNFLPWYIQLCALQILHVECTKAQYLCIY